MTTRRWPSHRMVSRCGIVMGILFLVSAVDTFVCGHLDGKHNIRALAGTRQAVSGDLSQPARRISDVDLHFDKPGLGLTVLEVRGRFWRGELEIPATADDGVYLLKAAGGSVSDPGNGPVCRITVFPSPAAMNASFPSLIRRFLGIPSWWIAAGTAPLLAVCLMLSFFMAADRETGLEAEGLVPIVKLARRKDHWELAGALMHGHGVVAGDTLTVTDRHRRPVACMRVTHIENDMAFGQATLTAPVVPDGYLRIPS